MEAHLEVIGAIVLVSVLSGCAAQPEAPAIAESAEAAAAESAGLEPGPADTEGGAAQPAVDHPWPRSAAAAQSLGDIPPPPGFQRVPAPATGFNAWLRSLPLLPEGTPVRLHDGRRKWNQRAQHAVVDIDIGEEDLQQCADAVIRLRAEYLRAAGCVDAVGFNFTSGDPARWSDWAAGVRPAVRGNKVDWATTAEPDASYDSFRRYLNLVFMYAGSASLALELERVADPADVRAGDVFIQGGFPGHAVIVVDVAHNAAGERMFLLAQSYMPAQNVHVLRGPGDSPWYPARSAGNLETPEWSFEYTDLRRFPTVCPAEEDTSNSEGA